jgi:hypothetical protein
MTLVRRRLVSLAVLGVIVVAAVAVIYWREGRSELLSAQKEKQRAVFSLSGAEAIKELLIKNGSNQVVITRNAPPAPAGWSITKPILTEADATTVDALVRDLVDLKRSRSLEETAHKKGEDLVLFGLDKPRVEVTVTLADGTSQTLAVGKKNSFDDTLYVKRAKNDDILIVPGTIFYQLDVDLYKLRDKRVVKFETNAITRLTVSRNAQPAYTVEKSGDNYQFSAPQKALADTGKIRNLLSSLTSLRANRFATEKATATDLLKYNLTPPAVRVALEAGSTTNGVTVLMSSVKEDSKMLYYVMREGDSPIMEVSAENLMSELGDDFGALRDKRVLHFDRDAVSTIVLQGESGAPIKLTRADATRDTPERWQIAEPSQSPADPVQISSLLFKLWDLQAARMVTDQAKDSDLKAAGLDKPVRTISLLNKDGVELAALLFGSQSGDKQMMKSRSQSAVAEVAKAKAAEISFALTDYQQKQTESAK